MAETTAWRCPRCGRAFATHIGLGLHFAWHRRTDTETPTMADRPETTTTRTPPTGPTHYCAQCGATFALTRPPLDGTCYATYLDTAGLPRTCGGALATFTR